METSHQFNQIVSREISFLKVGFLKTSTEKLPYQYSFLSSFKIII
jgi:hypothetical protein